MQIGIPQFGGILLNPHTGKLVVCRGSFLQRCIKPCTIQCAYKLRGVRITVPHRVVEGWPRSCGGRHISHMIHWQTNSRERHSNVSVLNGHQIEHENKEPSLDSLFGKTKVHKIIHPFRMNKKVYMSILPLVHIKCKLTGLLSHATCTRRCLPKTARYFAYGYVHNYSSSQKLTSLHVRRQRPPKRGDKRKRAPPNKRKKEKHCSAETNNLKQYPDSHLCIS